MFVIKAMDCKINVGRLVWKFNTVCFIANLSCWFFVNIILRYNYVVLQRRNGPELLRTFWNFTDRWQNFFFQEWILWFFQQVVYDSDCKNQNYEFHWDNRKFVPKIYIKLVHSILIGFVFNMYCESGIQKRDLYSMYTQYFV